MQPRGSFQTPPACPIGHRNPQRIKQRPWHFDYARGSKLSTIAAYIASTSVCDVTRLSGLSAGAVRHGIPLITRFERRQGPSRGGGRAIHCPTQGLRQSLTPYSNERPLLCRPRRKPPPSANSTAAIPRPSYEPVLSNSHSWSPQPQTKTPRLLHRSCRDKIPRPETLYSLNQLAPEMSATIDQVEKTV